MLFTFRRETDGRETILVRDIAIARVTEGPEGFEWLNSFPGITAEHIRDAAGKADEAGFWTPFLPATPFRILPATVTVDVPVAETTSTIFTLDTSEDQS